MQSQCSFLNKKKTPFFSFANLFLFLFLLNSVYGQSFTSFSDSVKIVNVTSSKNLRDAYSQAVGLFYLRNENAFVFTSGAIGSLGVMDENGKVLFQNSEDIKISQLFSKRAIVYPYDFIEGNDGTIIFRDLKGKFSLNALLTLRIRKFKCYLKEITILTDSSCKIVRIIPVKSLFGSVVLADEESILYLNKIKGDRNNKTGVYKDFYSSKNKNAHVPIAVIDIPAKFSNILGYGNKFLLFSKESDSLFLTNNKFSDMELHILSLKGFINTTEKRPAASRSFFDKPIINLFFDDNYIWVIYKSRFNVKAVEEVNFEVRIAKYDIMNRTVISDEIIPYEIWKYQAFPLALTQVEKDEFALLIIKEGHYQLIKFRM